MLTKLPKISKISIVRAPNQYWMDILLSCLVAMIGGWFYYQNSQLLDPTLLNEQASGVWFESDTSRVFANMTDPRSDHMRDKVHPLFSPIAYPLVQGIHLLTGTETITAMQLAGAVIASVWLGAFSLLLRLVGCRRPDTLVFSVLAAVSAAALFWFTVPETYPLGSLTIVLALGIVAVAEYQTLSRQWYIFVSAATLSITITNWMAGILATWVNHSRQRSLVITGSALFLVIVLWFGKQLVFDGSTVPFISRDEVNYLFMPEAGGPLRVLQSLLAHTIVMPAIEVVNRYPLPHWPLLITQNSAPGSANLWGTIAVVLWMALLGLGIWSLFSLRQQLKLRIVLGLTLLGQLALHVAYGAETFLYALHVLPLIVLLAALSTLTRWRWLGLLLAVLVLLSAGVNNFQQFTRADEEFRRIVQIHLDEKTPQSLKSNHSNSMSLSQSVTNQD